MTHSVFDSPPRRITKLVVVGVGIAVVAVVFGAWGMWRYESDNHGHPDVLSVGYHTLQLFILHAPHLEHPVNWQIHAGRWLSAVFVVWALIKGLSVLFGGALRLQWIGRRGGHVIVCGLGHLGKQIAKEFLQGGKNVVVIEADGSKVGAAPTKAAVVVGDASDASQLQRAGLTTAKQLIAVCDDVQTNVAIATIAGEVLRSGGAATATGGELTSWLFVPDAPLRQLLKQNQLFPHTGSRFQVNVRGLDLFSLAARQAIEKSPLDHRPIHADSATTVHLLVVGFGPAGQRVVLQAARIGHFANEKQLKITVFDRPGSPRIAEFLARYSKFKEVVDFKSHEIDLEASDVVAPILDVVGKRDELASVALCWDSLSDTVTSENELFGRLEKDDAVNLRLALGILHAAARRMPRTMLFQTRDCGFARLFRRNGTSDSALNHVHVFGTIEQTCSLDALMHESTDTVARALHEDWRKKEAARPKKDGEQQKEADRPWGELAEMYRESNRNAADHIPVKLRAIGLVMDKRRSGESSLNSFKAAQVELLARMEHNRWRVELLLQCRTNPSMIPWDQLDEPTKDFDRSQVRAIPQAIEQVGLGIYSIPRGNTVSEPGMTS